ncbi:MAG: Rieske (2Fe-2S) protein [Bacteroidales bacterium]|nr:Rieske (2Fe-2S) protein [Bacteroidales bacterium]
MSENKHTRRNFLKIAGGLIGLSAVGMWAELTKNQIDLLNKKTVTFPFNPNREISFTDEFIIKNSEGKVITYSAHCTHMGCIINKEINGKLICPCHGSEYNLNGIPVKGPAYKPLEKFKTTLSTDQKQVIIET